MRKILIVLLCAALLCSMLPFSAAAGDGYFFLTVLTSGRTLVAPTAVNYRSGQTLREALLDAEPTFGGLENGFITDINGVDGNYTIFYDDGGSSLDVPAADVTSLLISERESCPKEVTALAAALGAFNLRTDHVQSYPDAKAAYDRALNGLRTADADTAATLLAALNSAVSAYEALLAGPKYSVTFSASGAKRLTLTDSYGNVTAVEGTQAQVIAGTYTFCVSDGGCNRTEGTLTVDKNVSKTVTLPTGQWFGTVTLNHTSGSGDYAYPRTVEGANAASYAVEDFRTAVYLNAQMGSVPNEKTTVLYACYIGQNGQDYGDGSVSSNRRSWESTQMLLPSLLTADMSGRTFTLEARYPDAEGNTQIQSYTVRIDRKPTLAALTVTGDGTVLPLDFAPQTTEYTVTTVSDTLELTAVPFGAEGYSVTVNDRQTNTVSVRDGDTITVRTAHESGAQTAYTLHVKKAAAVTVSPSLPDSETTISVRNAAGCEIAPRGDGTYRLIPGEKYSYIATKGTHFHTTADFIAAEGLTVPIAAPETGGRLTDFALYSAMNPAKGFAYAVSPSPQAATHEYTVTVPDANSAVYVQATGSDDRYGIFARYNTQTAQTVTNGTEKEQALSCSVDPNGTASICSQLLAIGGNSNTLTLRLRRESGGVTYYQDYTLHLIRRLTLRELSLSVDGTALTLTNADGKPISFSRDVAAYHTRVVNSTRELTLNGALRSDPTEGNPNSGGYSVLINGTSHSALQAVAVPLEPTQSVETLHLTVCHTDASAISAEYTVTIQKTAPAYITIQTDPADAVVFIVNELTGRSVSRAADGRFPMTPGDRYRITVTAAGRVGVQQTGYVAPEGDETLVFTLEKAAENNELQELDAQWPSFRADECNNGVIDAPTPITAEESVLYWAAQVGVGYASDAVGCPILVDDCLYTYAADKLYRIDKYSGKVLDVGQMDHKSSFAINSPTYAEGMIFVGLSDGCIQAFNAVTLEPLWIYRDPLGGQPNCPIVYHDGYLYTGFWRQETESANFVCLSVTDEDPTRTDETKLASWYYTSKGGFYWAGAYVCDRFALIPTDDGETGYLSGHSRILSFDPLSGTLLDELTLPDTGDARSSVTFVRDSADSASGTAYFTTKGGYFYGVHVDAEGRFGKLRAVRLSNGADDASKPAMSTCTPTIYNGRAYIGVSGTSQFGAYSGHNLTVIDLAAMSVAYSVPTQGYPQTSGILTTAYDGGDGTVYVYFFDNYTPGKLRILCDRPGQTEPLLTTQETAVINGKPVSVDTARVLFTPDGEQAQYAICSPIVDADGTIYFKNDSGYLMALGSVPTRLDVTAPPEKTVYHVGETFDPTGMSVTAVYANGTARDVTAYVSFSDAPLTKDDNSFQLTLNGILYQDRDGVPGTVFHAPVGIAELSVRTHIYTSVETNETGHRGVCGYCGATEEDFRPHEFTWVIDRAATEQEVGLKHEECDCGYRRNENTEIPRLTHTHRYTQTVTPPTCTERGYTTHICSACGESYQDAYTDALGHDYRNGVCTRCGAKDPAYKPDDPTPPTPQIEFKDIPSNAWFREAVDYAVANGLMNGVGENTFDPNGSMTRAMLVTVLWRYAGQPKEGTNVFTDVPDGQWFSDAVAWAAQNGVVNGVGSGRFDPNGKITREQMAVILFRYTNKLGLHTDKRGDLGRFADASKVSSYASDALRWAVAEGIIGGSSDGGRLCLNPQGNATRAEVATILMRYIENILK